MQKHKFLTNLFNLRKENEKEKKLRTCCIHVITCNVHSLHFIQFRKSDQSKISSWLFSAGSIQILSAGPFLRRLIKSSRIFFADGRLINIDLEKTYRKDSNKCPGAYSLFAPLRGRLFKGGAYSSLYGIYIFLTLFKHYL